MSPNPPSWDLKYPDAQVRLDKLYINREWSRFFSRYRTKRELKQISQSLSQCMNAATGPIQIYPYPDNLFNCFNRTPLSQIRVVILGQDPYFNCKGTPPTPQATGLSFSVPLNVPTPPSLQNIYKNLYNYGHIRKIPNHGDLRFWADQGCLLLNTSLTVLDGSANSHMKYWQRLTNRLIQFISDNTNKTVFLLWGGNAMSKKVYIDSTKHLVLVSSHPSGLSCNKRLGVYPAFDQVDHFGQTNRYLEQNGKDRIIWDLATY